jgi:hypothetical protein
VQLFEVIEELALRYRDKLVTKSWLLLKFIHQKKYELISVFQRPYAPSAQYSYNNWSPPAQSNESANGYFLERSNSARKTLERACELCPEEVCYKDMHIHLIVTHLLNF